MLTPQITNGQKQEEEDLANAALQALRKRTGIDGQLVPPPDGRRRVQFDVIVRLNTNRDSSLFYGECKQRVDRRSIVAQVKGQLEGLDAPGLLVAPYLSDAMIDACRTIGLYALDTAGNAYLDVPGLYVLVKGQKATTYDATQQQRGGSASALRMIFVLLANPALVWASYREIAAAAGIALGGVGWIFRDLAQRGLVSGRDRTHGRQILQPERLLDEWVTTYPIRLRPKLRARRFRVQEPAWWQTVDPIELDAWWGGDVAADRLTGLLKPATQTLYVAPNQAQRSIQSLVARHRLRPHPDGEVEVLDAFWNLPRNPTHPQVAPPVLVYADLLASLDSRSLAVARTIRDLVLADVHVQRSL